MSQREAEQELDALASSGLLRRLRRLDSPQGRSVKLDGQSAVLNFSSNDYLGLAHDPELIAIFQEHTARYGTGSGASRLVCGTMSAHLELEDAMAALKHTQAALTFTSGFAAATGTIPALCKKDDILILDKLCHASLIDGARLSGATLRIFPHNDLDRLEQHLDWAARKRGVDSRVLVVTESVFSMDGDTASLAEICALKESYDALLLVDEAHAFGVLGPSGRGLAAALGLENCIDIQMGTFSKALGLSGGYIAGSRPLIDLLINRARSFIYTTAPGPALAATIRDALDILTGTRGDALRHSLARHRDTIIPGTPSAIIPVLLGENETALQASDALLKAGFLVPAIRYPTVPRGSARLRITLSAAHQDRDVAALKTALSQIITDFPSAPASISLS